VTRRLSRVGQKSGNLLVIVFPLLLDALYVQFLFTYVSFSSNDVVLHLLMLISSVFMRIKCNFIAMVGLANDENCLIHISQSARGKTEQPGFRKNRENVFE